MWSGKYTQDQLPSELFHNIGNVTYQGQTYNVSNNGDGTRTITPSGGGSGGGNIPAFNFSWDQAEKEALEKLAPYYKQKLDESNGDVELAKQRIEEDYQRGLRQRTEDTNIAMTTDTQTAKEETTAAREGLNQRGLLFGNIPEGQPNQSAAPTSQFAQTQELNPLADKQQQRRMAIQRALDRQNEVAGIEKSRTLTDTNTQATRYARDLENEKKEKAVLQMAPLKYNQEYAKYQATVGQSVNQNVNPYMQ